eukprot:5278024-Pleurochrysis_carterae.AAC.1
MIKELERVEAELRRRERAELESLRAQLTLALRGSQMRPAHTDAAVPLVTSTAAPAEALPPPADAHPSASHAHRLEACAAFSIMLNVAALSAAIAIGAM